LWIGRRGQAECLTCDLFLSAGAKTISADQNEEKLDEMEQQIPDTFEAFPLDFFKNSVGPLSSSFQ
jgi:NADP-dependent 3-hydroxy acid dehydrogenase YdfG